MISSTKNPKVAAARLKMEKPRSVFFYDWKTRLRVDLLLEFPLPTRDIVERAAKMGKKPRTLRVAAPEDAAADCVSEIVVSLESSSHLI